MQLLEEKIWNTYCNFGEIVLLFDLISEVTVRHRENSKQRGLNKTSDCGDFASGFKVSWLKDFSLVIVLLKFIYSFNSTIKVSQMVSIVIYMIEILILMKCIAVISRTSKYFMITKPQLCHVTEILKNQSKWMLILLLSKFVKRSLTSSSRSTNTRMSTHLLPFPWMILLYYLPMLVSECHSSLKGLFYLNLAFSETIRHENFVKIVLFYDAVEKWMILDKFWLIVSFVNCH